MGGRTLVLGGAGAIGREVVRDLALTSDFDEILGGDRDVSAAERLVGEIGDGRLAAVGIDVTQRRAVESLMADRWVATCTTYHSTWSEVRSGVADHTSTSAVCSIHLASSSSVRMPKRPERRSGLAAGRRQASEWGHAGKARMTDTLCHLECRRWPAAKSLVPASWVPRPPSHSSLSSGSSPSAASSWSANRKAISGRLLKRACICISGP